MILYMHPELGNGRVTLAINVEEDKVTVASSFCSPNDQFNRAKGRMIAKARLDVGKRLFEFVAKPGEPIKKQVMHRLPSVFAMYEQLRKEEPKSTKWKRVPNWAKRATS